MTPGAREGVSGGGGTREQVGGTSSPGVDEGADGERVVGEGGVWGAVAGRFASQAAYAYLEWLRLGEVREDVVVVHSLPGRREVLAGVTQRHREELGRAFSEVLGRRVRVELTPPPAKPDVEGEDGPGESRRGPSRLDQREAMGLPLVQEVLRVFPDARIVGAWREGGSALGSESGSRGASSPGVEEGEAEGEWEAEGED